MEDYLRNSQALEDDWHQPITVKQLQAEIDRMAQHTKQPEVLRELFEALGNDPFVIAECVARPALVERLMANLDRRDQKQLGSSQAKAKAQGPREVAAIDSIAKAVQVNRPYHLPRISEAPSGCVDNWTATSTINAPTGRYLHTAVWTGSEMIVWGGYDGSFLNTGGRYNPSTDSWIATSTTNAPVGRQNFTAVWTGSEMIVWGGQIENLSNTNTGGRYNPGTDTWTSTSTTNAPIARDLHTAVWTGSEMIVWGGFVGTESNTGGRYDPSTDSWTATSTTTAPTARFYHTAVWTGSAMIVWGGRGNNSPLNIGARYDPSTDSWTPTSTTNAPSVRQLHTAVWTGSEMIVWGGSTAPMFSIPAATTILTQIVGQPRASSTRLLSETFTRQCGPAVK